MVKKLLSLAVVVVAGIFIVLGWIRLTTGGEGFGFTSSAVRTPESELIVETPAPTPTPEAPVGAVGQRVELTGIALTVNAVRSEERLGKLVPAREGHVYVVVDVTIENLDDADAPYSSVYFDLQGPGEERYLLATGHRNVLSTGEVDGGARVQGAVAFLVPVGATNLTLSYEPQMESRDYAPIRIAIGEIPGPS